MSLVGISAAKYLLQDKYLRGWHTSSITGQRLIFLVLPCFYKSPARVKIFVCFLPAFAKFKPAPLELEKSCPLPPRTLLSRTRPADHPNPCPSRTFSVPIPRLSEKTAKNSSPLNTCLTSSKIKLIIPFIGNQKSSTHLIYRRSDQPIFPHIWSTAFFHTSDLPQMVALENGNGEMLTCLVPTTWRERALMFCKNGLLHRNVIIALDLLA